MRKAKIKTYLYTLVVFLIFMYIVPIILQHTSPEINLLIFIISIFLEIYFVYFLINYILFMINFHFKLDVYRCIPILERIQKIHFLKNENKINLSVVYLLINEKEKALKIIESVKITKMTLPITKYVYFWNLAEYKYLTGEKEEARKIFDENIEREKKKIEIEILLDYENEPERKIIELKKILKGKSKIQKVQITFNLAKTYEEIGKFEKAIECYEYVAGNGNKLYITEVAREKVLELNEKLENKN